VKTGKHYVGLNHLEIQALGQVSGEAFRLYVAVASFAYGRKTVAHPTWKMISDRMGKKLSPASGQALAKKLEAAGLLKRGKFGASDGSRWTLTLKQQVLEGSQNMRETLTNEEGSPSQNMSPPLTKDEGVNNKKNKRKKDYHIENKEEENINENSMLELEDGEMSIVEVTNRLLQNRRNILGWGQRDRSRILRRLTEEGLEELVRDCNKAIWPNRWT